MKEHVLNHFEEWFNNNATLLNEAGLHFTITHSAEHNANNSIYVDVQCEKYMGRITCWESGDCDQEILSLVTEETTFWKHEALENIEELDAVLEKFYQHLSSAS
jgi:hypothetical protein